MVVREPVSAAAFAALALGVLLERIAVSTDELVRLRHELRADAPKPSRSLPENDLARTCAELEDHGWLFGLLARELGSDVLFERRERRGLSCALGLVGELLERDGIVLWIPALPELDSNDERCSTICAVVAHCVHSAHVADKAPEWNFKRDAAATSLCFTGSVEKNLERALVDGAARIEGSRICRDFSGMQLVLPPNCAVWP